MSTIEEPKQKTESSDDEVVVEKKEKKEKKKKEKKKEKKKKKREDELRVPEIKTLKLKRSEEFLSSEKFRPVPNPLFNPTLISPMSSPKPTGSLPAIHTAPLGILPHVVVVNTDSHGSQSDTYIPAGSSHLKNVPRPDPKHSAFNKLQQVVNAGPASPPSRPSTLPDGTAVLQYAKAMWDYSALIPTELDFKANEQFAVITKQPDGWWYSQSLITSKKGLIPGNYMTPL